MKKDEYFGDDLPICIACLQQYKGNGKENLSYICCVCGRSGFCKFCAKPENHDCIDDVIE